MKESEKPMHRIVDVSIVNEPLGDDMVARGIWGLGFAIPLSGVDCCLGLWTKSVGMVGKRICVDAVDTDVVM